jgi:hypothetical protein
MTTWHYLPVYRVKDHGALGEEVYYQLIEVHRVEEADGAAAGWMEPGVAPPSGVLITTITRRWNG